MGQVIIENLSELEKHNYIWLRSRGYGMTYLTHEYIKYLKNKNIIEQCFNFYYFNILYNRGVFKQNYKN